VRERSGAQRHCADGKNLKMHLAPPPTHFTPRVYINFTSECMQQAVFRITSLLIFAPVHMICMGFFPGSCSIHFELIFLVLHFGFPGLFMAPNQER
jgi:hypothetical protein